MEPKPATMPKTAMVLERPMLFKNPTKRRIRPRRDSNVMVSMNSNKLEEGFVKQNLKWMKSFPEKDQK
jgi:hypothetical protein